MKVIMDDPNNPVPLTSKKEWAEEVDDDVKDTLLMIGIGALFIIIVGGGLFLFWLGWEFLSSLIGETRTTIILLVAIGGIIVISIIRNFVKTFSRINNELERLSKLTHNFEIRLDNRAPDGFKKTTRKEIKELNHRIDRIATKLIDKNDFRQ